MTNLLEQGADWLVGQNREHMSSAVTYVRGDEQVSVLAKLGRTQYEAQGLDGLTVTAESRDYIVAVSDLVLAGLAAEPRVGDRIVDASGAQWEAVTLPDRKCYERVESDLAYRIHVKRVADDEES